MWLESFKVRNRLVQHIKNVDINLFPVFVYYNQGLSLGQTIELDSITKLVFSKGVMTLFRQRLERSFDSRG